MKHLPRKRFGQHFLTDAGVIDAIVQAINPRSGQTVVEIGPGLGALTYALLERLPHMVVIELDRDLAAHLQGHIQLSVVQADVLKVDFAQMAQAQGATKLRVVGNLPYNISTPILFHLLDSVDCVEDQHFMLQKEVVDRMVAPVGGASYGRLSVMLQWRYAMERVLDVLPQSFDPPPRVDSAVVRMAPLAVPPEVDQSVLARLVQVAFSQRRKLLRHTLGVWLQERATCIDFDLQRRAQEVSVPEYLALAQALTQAALSQ